MSEHPSPFREAERQQSGRPDSQNAAGALRGRRVLVTGADGFIGSHVVERLVADGADVRALCCYNSNGSYGWLDELPDVRAAVDLRLGDVRDPGSVEAAVNVGDEPYRNVLVEFKATARG